MKPILQHSRHPDITFNRNGMIRITTRVARILQLRPGDSINISVSDGEFFLFAVRHSRLEGRFHAKCHLTNRGYHNFCCYSAQLSRAVIDAVSPAKARVALLVGEEFVRNGILLLPIITRCPL
ncbi:MAG: hypothetical protein K2M06_01865 [Muribaculaceae bacterium]|nr:hypothetical protein [Muribaculaceae bacterium]